MSGTAMYMTDLERRLGHDTRGELRAALSARLRTLEAELHADLRRLHGVEHFQRLSAAAAAVRAADEALQVLFIPKL